LSKAVKIWMPEWLWKWIHEVSGSDETTVSEFLRLSAVDRCERQEREGSSRVPRAIRSAARGAKKGLARGRISHIAEALGRATETVGDIHIEEPIRSLLKSALQDLDLATDLLFDHEVPLPGCPSNDNDQ
jgi:hypothetical protein